MTSIEAEQAYPPVFDLSDLNPAELERLASNSDDSFVLVLPVPSIGSSNSHIDICDDLIEVSWAAECVAAVSASVTVREYYDQATYTTRYPFTVKGPGLECGTVICKCATLFNRDDQAKVASTYLYSDVRDDVLDYEDKLCPASAPMRQIEGFR